jgi:hypothetical protein
MKGVKIFDHNLFDFFNDDEPFLLAENLREKFIGNMEREPQRIFNLHKKVIF